MIEISKEEYIGLIHIKVLLEIIKKIVGNCRTYDAESVKNTVLILKDMLSEKTDE